MFTKFFALRFTLQLTLLLSLASGSSAVFANNSAMQDAEAALHVLDYLGVDYPATVHDGKVLDPAEYAEQLEFSERLTTLMANLPPADPAAERLREQAHQVHALIKQRAPGQELKAISTTMSHDLILTYKVATAPRHLPDIAQAATTFQAHCSGCHGSEGRGDGPDALGLTPAPANFLDRARQDQRSLYGLYNTISLGVEGTAMRSFAEELNSEQRWALAFYVGSLAYPPSLTERGAGRWQQQPPTELNSLSALTALTMTEAQGRWGDDGPAVLAYLRQHPEQLMPKASENLALARTKLAESLKAFSTGNREDAQSAAVAAYLEGFEPLENGLRARDPALVQQIEKAMANYRQALRKSTSSEDVQVKHEQALSLLNQAETRMQDERLSSGAAFFSAFIILLREGLEAILVLAAIAAVLIKTGRRDALRYLHAGWISALLLGGATWGLASYVIGISGAGRELTEGITALLAAAVLLYVGFWLHGKTQGQRWQQFVKTRIQNALQGGALWMLALASFLAVYREVFETVLFYQALWLQSTAEAGSALFAGITTAAGLLVLLGWIILRSSLRLPLRLVFNINSVIMLVLAVAFAGHGINNLQEAGHLPVDPVSFPHIGLLGVYPNLEALLTQGALILLIGGILWIERRRNAAALAH